MDKRPQIAVVGPGAVGGLIAALLHRAGEDVCVVARAAAAAAISEHGITVRSGHFGSWTAKVATKEHVPHGARVILATKAFALPDVLPLIRDADPREIISLLNGLDHMQELRKSCPGASVAGAAITVEAARSSPTVIEHRSPFLRIAVPAGSADTATIESLRTAGVHVTARDPEDVVLWNKFRFLAPLALLTAYWNLPIGPALAHDKRLTAGILSEVSAVATADGSPTAATTVAEALNKLPPGMRSSLQLDVAAGKQSELDAIGGALIRRARTHSVLAPTIMKMVDELRIRNSPESSRLGLGPAT